MRAWMDALSCPLVITQRDGGQAEEQQRPRTDNVFDCRLAAAATVGSWTSIIDILPIGYTYHSSAIGSWG